MPARIQFDEQEIEMPRWRLATVEEPNGEHASAAALPAKNDGVWWKILLALAAAGALAMGIIALARGTTSSELKKSTDEVKTAVANAAAPVLAEAKRGTAAGQLAAANALAADQNAATRHDKTLAAITADGKATREALEAAKKAALEKANEIDCELEKLGKKVDGVGGAVRRLGAGLAQHERNTEAGFLGLRREIQAMPAKIRVIVHPGAGTLRLIGGKVTAIK